MNPAASSGKATAICVNNGESLLVNVDAANGYKNVSTDMTSHHCDHPKLSAVTLDAD